MSRRYGDLIEVRSGTVRSGTVRSGSTITDPGRGGVAPEQFLWRGRLYVVRSVLAHWIEVGAWWRFASALDLERAEPESAEREVWRVEATSGRAAASGIYDLCCDGAVDCHRSDPTGSVWRLVRTID